MFNEITTVCDYENSTNFVSDRQMLAKYNKYARRDFALLKSELEGVETILEIGSGYGLLSVCIKQHFPAVKYCHYEKNLSLREVYRTRGDRVLDSLEDSVNPDLIIMAHCLEHLEDAPDYLRGLADRFPRANIVLFQTNPYGFIPSYLPWLWYGWSFDQHYYHFSVRSLTELMRHSRRRLSCLKFYKLHQEFSFSLKGVIKSGLAVLNLFVGNDKCDAFMVRFSRAESCVGAANGQ